MANLPYNIEKTGASIKSAINSAIMKLDEIAFDSDRVLISAGQKVKPSIVTKSELEKLGGIESNIQAQLNTKHGDGDSISGTLYIGNANSQLLVSKDTDYTINYTHGIAAIGLSYESGVFMKTIKSGRYIVSFSGKYMADKPNPIIQATVFTGPATLNMTATYISSGAKAGGSGDLRSGGAYGMLDLDANTYVNVRVRSSIDNTTIDHLRASFSMVRIGSKGA